jgi:2-dehydro-3-deoxyphosphogluconate aldolase / (4S)-4-hydroxy-2-oxoglutarate aldolase
MHKFEVIRKIMAAGLVGVIRAENTDQAMKTIDACIKGGIVAIEVTFTVPRALHIIEELAAQYKETEVVLGAGTVLDSETARAAILAGAEYIVSPTLNGETLKLCNRYQVPCIPGAMSIREVIEALEGGADIVKIFPGELFGPKVIKAIKGPLPQANLMPTGGVDLENVSQWIKSGAVAVAVGANLTVGAKTGDYDLVTKAAAKFVREIKKARMYETS